MKIFFIFFTLILSNLFISFVLQASPLFRENGTMRTKVWYYDKYNIYLDELFEAFKYEGINPIKKNWDFDYLQDVLFTGQNGEFIILADFPINNDVLSGLTRAVFDDEDGFYVLNRVDQDHAISSEVGHRQLKWTFMEGGGIISGKFKDGADFVLLREVEVNMTVNYYYYLHKKYISYDEAKLLIAKDLEVLPENIFILPIWWHLDLSITALPNNKILINNPNRVVPTLEEIVKNQEINSSDKVRIQSIINFYKEGHQKYDIYGEPIGSKIVPINNGKLKALEKAVKVLQERFDVVEIPGEILELDRHTQFSLEKINFFNGFMGLNINGDLFNITNKGNGIKALEDYWVNVLKSNSNIKTEHIHFVGNYGYGAGLDCAGVSGH